MAKAVIVSLLPGQAATGTVSCSTNPKNAGLPDSYHPYHEKYNNAKINLLAFTLVPDNQISVVCYHTAVTNNEDSITRRQR